MTIIIDKKMKNLIILNILQLKWKLQKQIQKNLFKKNSKIINFKMKLI